MADVYKVVSTQGDVEVTSYIYSAQVWVEISKYVEKL